MKKQLLLLALAAGLALLFPQKTSAQFQNLKGRIVDKAVRAELPGATVQLGVGTGAAANLRGAATDEQGRFRFDKLPVGRYSLTVSFIGYKTAVVPNVELIAGKETDLLIELEEAVTTGREAVIKARFEKEKPLNELSTVSTRTFSVDETRRFAAAFSDPARMASSFAGVVGANDGNNFICIRGNAPNGLLWRMEGVDIPNPNHFSALGTSGGGISIITAQLLSNSDFSTGAFAAEYGNATSGVFDLRLRKGNPDRREQTLSVSLLGLDAATEGPLRMGRQTGSYLVNYRYSTLGLLDKIGVPLGSQTIKYQDLSFNIWMPAGRAGSFSLFGMGGLSIAQSVASADSADWKKDFWLRYDDRFTSDAGVVGLTHNKTFGKNTWLKTVVAASATRNGDEVDKTLLPGFSKRREFETANILKKWTASAVLSHRFSPRHYLRTGAYFNQIGFEVLQSDYDIEREKLVERLQNDGQTQTVQAFAQWQYRPTERVTFNAGLHALGLFLNETWSLEPRAALKYAIDQRQSVSLGFGIHGQVQPFDVYFVKNAGGSLVNPELEISKARHLVLSHDLLLRKNLRLKTEAYHQRLYNVPVSAGEKDSYSILNRFAETPYQPLENTGRGRNYGLELTAEQFLSRGFYCLATTSFFRSEYKGSDGIWRNTIYDSRWAATLTGGKEWDFTRRGRDRSFGVNIKLVSTGGRRQSPIDLAASIAAGEEVADDSRAFEDKMPAYFRLDAGLKLKRNYRRLTSTVSLDVQNTTNRKNVGGRYFDPENLVVKYYHQAPLIPVLAYKVEF